VHDGREGKPLTPASPAQLSALLNFRVDPIAELQADEIRTIVRSKKNPIWIFTTMDVWSRLWPSTIVRRQRGVVS